MARNHHVEADDGSAKRILRIRRSRIEEEFLDAGIRLLDPKIREQGKFIDFDYLDRPSQRNKFSAGIPSGSDLWDSVVFLGSTSGYYPPTSEVKMIYSVIGRELCHQVSGVTNVIDAGSGKANAVINKTFPTLRALLEAGTGTKTGKEPIHYRPVDLHKESCTTAALLVDHDFDSRLITAKPVHGDFAQLNSQALSLAEGRSLILMYGLTATQFPLAARTHTNAGNAGKSRKKSEPVQVPEQHMLLEDALRNLRTSINGDGYLLLTIDTNKDRDSAIGAYSGQHFRVFKENIWRMLAAVANDKRNDRNFNPGMIAYSPRWDEENSRIVHSYRSDRDQELYLRQQANTVLASETYVGGYSEKRTVREVEPVAARAGWHLKKVFDHNGSPIRALLLEAKP